MPFELKFGSCSQLSLQNLKSNDISIFVLDKFDMHTGALRLVGEAPELVSQLVEEIVQTSCGVCLWLSFVVKSLSIGMTNYDRISDSQKGLRKIPPEFDDPYSHMITKIQPSI